VALAFGADHYAPGIKVRACASGPFRLWWSVSYGVGLSDRFTRPNRSTNSTWFCLSPNAIGFDTIKQHGLSTRLKCVKGNDYLTSLNINTELMEFIRLMAKNITKLTAELEAANKRVCLW
jgi:hypothetical protein